MNKQFVINGRIYENHFSVKLYLTANETSKMSFSGKVVLVTGASSGIGADVAVEFAKLGARVALVGRNETRLNKVQHKIGKSVSIVIVADVVKDAPRIIEKTIQSYGKLDILVNNAGVFRTNTASNIDLETYDEVMNINCRSIVELTKLAVPHLITTNGNVVIVSSISGLKPYVEEVAYCMSKAAIDMYTKCASLELAPKGVRVNSVNPGVIDTPIFKTLGLDDASVKAHLEKERKSYPVGRVGVTADTTNAILFLASEKSSFINGVNLVVDGGSIIF